ncbi:unnamed protein product [Hydatigera taeniaeformis]|uniref:Uncharacterized protein n=1 Tax=Hydatigena taeniaeformis TaxID=6205 RepID=A0A0R3WVZ0_HYDTA|nr:unnamed protein product [Hydatigera taeniaeformis]
MVTYDRVVFEPTKQAIMGGCVTFQPAADTTAVLKERPANETIMTNQQPQQRKVTQSSTSSGLITAASAASSIPAAATAANQSGVGARQYRASRLPAPSTRMTRARANATSSTLLNLPEDAIPQPARNGDSDTTQHSIATDICESCGVPLRCGVENAQFLF